MMDPEGIHNTCPPSLSLCLYPPSNRWRVVLEKGIDMKKQIPPALFYFIVAVVFFIVVVILYRQATDPLYHRDPSEQRFIPPNVRQRPPQAMQPGARQPEMPGGTTTEKPTSTQ